jgi:hypothetical protein
MTHGKRFPALFQFERQVAAHIIRHRGDGKAMAFTFTIRER